MRQVRLWSVLFVLLAMHVEAAIIRVPQDQPTLQQAISVAVNGDVVLVSPGTYHENLTIDNKTIVLTSLAGAAETILQPAESYSRVLRMGGATNRSEVSGFTFAQSSSNAIQIDGAQQPLIRNCVFHHFGSEAIIITQGSPVISRNAFYKNTGISCIGVYGGNGTAEIYNNTFDRNRRGFYSLISTTIAENNVVYGSTDYGMYGAYSKNDYNDVYANGSNYDGGATPGLHSISAYPLFVDSANHDYNVLLGSPCHDAGDPDPRFNDIDGSRSDIGIGPQANGLFPLASYINLTPGYPPAVTSQNFTLHWLVLDSTGRSQTGYEIEVGTDNDWTIAENWATGPVVSTATDVPYAGAPLADGQWYTVRVRLSDEVGWGDWVSYHFYAHLSPILRVPSSHPTIQAAISAAFPDDSVVVSPGTYQENINFLGKRIVVLSELGAEVTTIHAASASIPVAKFASQEGRNSVLHGFKIEGASQSYGILCANTSPTVEYCIVTGNTNGGDGAGIFVTGGGPLIRYNKVFGNTSGGTGGGVGGTGSGGVEIAYNEIYSNNANAGGGIGFFSYTSNAKVHHNIIRHNPGTGSYAGGIYLNGSNISIFNNTVVSNSRGISILDGGNTRIFNNIVAFNTVYGVSPSAATLSYNDVYSNPGGNNPGALGISADPLFVSASTFNYSLSPGSPCINAGDPDPQYNDIDGSRADMGVGPLASGTFPLPISLFLTPGIPPAITAPNFTIFWHYLDSAGRYQTAYEIEAGTDLDWANAELWATGEVPSGDTSVAYAGILLNDGQPGYLRMRLRNEIGWGDWIYYGFYAHYSKTLLVPSVYPTIQAAISATLAGDTVLVAPGEYVENLSFHGHKAYLKSESGAATTTVRASNTSVPAIQFIDSEDTLSVVDGFTVKAGASNYSVFCQFTKPIIQNCNLTVIAPGNGPGAGVRVQSASPIIRYNRIFGQAYGVFGSSASYAEISYNDIFQQTSVTETFGIIMDETSSRCSIHHNVVHHTAGSSSSSAGISVRGQYVRVYNNTVAYNRIGISTSSYLIDSIFNNIIAFNQGSGLAPNSSWFDYNDVYQNGSANNPGAHGISQDPKFEDPGNFNFELQASSPCIDAGNPDTLYNDIDATRGDIGALFRVQAATPFAPKLSIRPGDKFVAFAQTPTFYWHYFDSPASTQAGYEIEIGSDSDWSTAEYWASGQIMSVDTFAVYSGTPLEANKPYVVRIRLSNGTSWGDWREWAFGVHIGGPWRVPVHAGRISTLMSLAANGDSIIVSPGTYYDNFAFLGKSVVVTSDSGWQQTIIQAQSSGKPVVEMISGEGRGAILEKLSIRGARNAVGIRITNSSPIIRNCEITDNQDAAGGLSVNGGGPLIDGCQIHHNLATSPGAAIAGTINAPTEIAHNLIYENGGAGGGGILISVNAALDIHHNIFFRNHGSTASSAAIGLGYGSGIVRNNTLVSNYWGIQAINSAAHIFNNIITETVNDAIGSSSAYVDFNDTWNNGRNYAATGGNIQSDPLLADTSAFDFSLLHESPCIDAGDPDPAYFDPDGSRADMGAIARDQTGLARVVTLTLPSETLTRVVSPQPVFSWASVFPGGLHQQAFELQVGRDQDWEWVDLWEPGVITSTDTSIKYAGNPIRDGIQVYARLRVFDGTIWTSWYGLTFHMDNRPAVPTMIYPGDTTLLLVNKPDVAALVGTDKDGDHQSLVFELYRDSALQSIRVTSPLISDTNGTVIWTVTAPLLENYHYWWRVRSYDGYMYSDWSLPRSFWINQLAQVPTAAVLGSPPEIGNEPVYDLTPTFTWSDGLDPDPKDTVFYTLQLSLNESFTLAFTYPGLLVKSFTLEDSLPVGTTFWWRVNSTDRDGHSTMSLPLQFTTWRLGDIDHSGYPDLADLIKLIDFLYISGNPITPMWAGDVDGDCHVDISDITRMIDYLYLTFRPLDQGCSISAMTGQQFLQRIGVVKKPPQVEAAPQKSDTQ